MESLNIKGENISFLNKLQEKVHGFFKRNKTVALTLLASFQILAPRPASAGLRKGKLEEKGKRTERTEILAPSATREREGDLAWEEATLRLEQSFGLGIGNIDQMGEEEIRRRVREFVTSLSREELKEISRGHLEIHVIGESSHERLKKPLRMEDGSIISNNEELARYRAEELARIVFSELQSYVSQTKHVRIFLRYPEGGVDTSINEGKGRRYAGIELHLRRDRKDTRKALESVKDDILAIVVDQSASIDEEERRKILHFVEDLKEGGRDVFITLLEGSEKGIEKHYWTLLHLLEDLKGKEGTVWLSTDEIDASFSDNPHLRKRRVEIMRGLASLYKKSGKRILVQIFHPRGDGSFKIVDLTEHPDALVPSGEEYEKLIIKGGMEDYLRWYEDLPDIGDERRGWKRNMFSPTLDTEI